MESRYPIQPLPLDGVSTYPLAERKNKVTAEMFGKALDGSDNVLGFISKLPRILAGESLRNLIRAINYARASNKAIIWGMGGHVIKVGLGPVINDLMQHGFVTAVAMNGSAAIHDFEVAMGGATSEEVGDVLGSGKFGMVRETAEQMNGAINAARGQGIGLGEALGQAIVDGAAGFPYSEHQYPRRSLEEKDSRDGSRRRRNRHDSRPSVSFRRSDRRSQLP